MIRLARWLIQLSSYLTDRAYRARWREEWLGELDAVVEQRAGSALRFARGAPRDAWSSRSIAFSFPLRDWLGDMRDATRSLRRTPLQSLTIIVCLTLGSTVTVLMFGIVNSLTVAEMPGVQRRASLVSIESEEANGRRHGLTMGQFRGLPPAIPGLSSFGGELSWRFSTRASKAAVLADGAFVSGTYFQTLGSVPAAGRLIQPSDDRPGAPSVVVIGFGFWQTQFGGRADAIGTTIRIGDGSYQIVGVAPQNFIGLDVGDFGRDRAADRGGIWLPMSTIWTYPDYVAARIDDAAGPRLIARLDAAFSREAAEAHAQSIVVNINARAGSARSAAVRLPLFELVPGSRTGKSAIFIGLLMSVPLVVLASACANVGGVQLARAITRTHELSVRVSMGATRLRLVRLLVTETLLLSLTAGVFTWFVVVQALRLSAHVLPLAPAADWRVLIFSAVALPMAISLIAGAAPAWRATGFDVLSGLRLGARVGKSASPMLRRGVLIAQVALSCLLVVTAGALISGLRDISTAIGRPLEHVFVAEVRFADLGLPLAGRQALAREIAEGASKLPGVTMAAVSTSRPAYASNATCWSDTAKASVSGWDVTLGKYVTPAFFDVVELQPVAGRAFTAHETDAVVVNQSFLDDTRGQQPALGSVVRVRRGNAPSSLARIVGIVPDGYERAPRGNPRPICYLPYDVTTAESEIAVYLRSSTAGNLDAPTRTLLDRLDPRLSPSAIGTIAELMGTSHRAVSLITNAVATVSAMALLLALMGLFGTMSHATAQRTHEFGVRLALGARASTLAAQVVREAAAIVGAGFVLGVALAVPVVGVLRSGLLSSISMTAPSTMIAIAALFAAVAVIAALLPAHRASSINPVTALRAD